MIAFEIFFYKFHIFLQLTNNILIRKSYVKKTTLASIFTRSTIYECDLKMKFFLSFLTSQHSQHFQRIYEKITTTHCEENSM
jgi:hypothetical protein